MNTEINITPINEDLNVVWYEDMRSQFATSSKNETRKDRKKYIPYVLTEQSITTNMIICGHKLGPQSS